MVKKDAKGKVAVREKNEKASGAETELLAKLQTLVDDGNSVRGRDADKIKMDADELKQAMDEMTLSKAGKKKAAEQLKEIDDAASFEKNSGKFVQVLVMVVMFVPMILSLLETIAEFFMRPSMVHTPADLAGMNAVVTGGCGALGLELAILLAKSGAGVVIGCHEGSLEAQGDAEDRIEAEGLVKGGWGDEEREDEQDKGWVEMWPLQLESFAEVREFAQRVTTELNTLNLLVHNAAVKQGCVKTGDGHELVTQVNYLSPFLLSQLLLPKLNKVKGRVVYTTCDAGLTMPDYLPWPLNRTTAHLLPKVHLDGLGERVEGEEPGSIAGRCDPLIEYADSKLAVLLHSQELNRRLNKGHKSRGVAQAVNPGSMNNPFGHSDSVPTGKASMRSTMMSYFPPVWIIKKIYGFTVGNILQAMLRPTATGAEAVYHVTTSPALGKDGGGLYWDKAGPFTYCGKPEAECGRIPLVDQPAAVVDDKLAGRLWTRTKSAIGEDHMQPLAVQDGAPKKEPKKKKKDEEPEFDEFDE